MTVFDRRLTISRGLWSFKNFRRFFDERYNFRR